MILSLVRTQLLAVQPLLSSARALSGVAIGPVSEVRGDWVIREGCQEMANSEHRAPKEAHPQNDLVLVQQLRALCQRTVDDVGEVRLVANVEETSECEPLIPRVPTLIDPKILEPLEQFHQEEPKDTHGKTLVRRA